MYSALERVRQAARRDRKLRFTALLRHVYDSEMLREAYFCLEREAAPGVDRVTWRQYGEALEDNLRDLSERLKRGAYRAKPVLRVFIPKADGRQRPLGVPALEDKLVQRATVEVLTAARRGWTARSQSARRRPPAAAPTTRSWKAWSWRSAVVTSGWRSRRRAATARARCLRAFFDSRRAVAGMGSVGYCRYVRRATVVS